MKYLIYLLIFGIAVTSVLSSCSDHESEIDMNHCVKARIISVGKYDAIVDVQILPPLYTQAYKDSASTKTYLYLGATGSKTEFIRLIEENGETWFRYNISSLKANKTYDFSIYLPIYLGNGKNMLKLGPSNFEKNTSYHVVPKIHDFTTLTELTPVDLGLSVLWSDTDWGMQTNDHSTISRYEWTVNKQALPIYDDISGTEEDPVASVMGDGWRMPTTAEMQELIDKCDWSTWTYYKTLTGEIISFYKKVQGKGAYSNNYIELFPYKNQADETFIGTYWTSNVANLNSTSYPFYVNCLFFDKDNHYIQAIPNNYGTCYPIRPVKDR